MGGSLGSATRRQLNASEVQAYEHVQEKLIDSMTDDLLEWTLAGNKLHKKGISRVNENNLKE